jgi:hypothetical protein
LCKLRGSPGRSKSLPIATNRGQQKYWIPPISAPFRVASANSTNKEHRDSGTGWPASTLHHGLNVQFFAGYGFTGFGAGPESGTGQIFAMTQLTASATMHSTTR